MDQKCEDKADQRRANVREEKGKEKRTLEKQLLKLTLCLDFQNWEPIFSLSLSNFELGFWCLWLKVAFMKHIARNQQCIKCLAHYILLQNISLFLKIKVGATEEVKKSMYIFKGLTLKSSHFHIQLLLAGPLIAERFSNQSQILSPLSSYCAC